MGNIQDKINKLYEGNKFNVKKNSIKEEIENLKKNSINEDDSIYFKKKID